MKYLSFAATLTLAVLTNCSGEPNRSQTQDVSLRDRSGEVAVVYREGFAVFLRQCSELATTYDRYCPSERDPQQLSYLNYRKELARSFGVDADIVALGSAEKLAQVISEVEADIAMGSLSPADKERAKDYLARLTSSRDQFADELMKILASLDEGVELRLNGSYNQHFDKVLAPFDHHLHLATGDWWADPETGLVWRKIEDICWFDAMDHRRPNGESCYELTPESHHVKNHGIYSDYTCKKHLDRYGSYNSGEYSSRFAINATFPGREKPVYEIKKGCSRKFGKVWSVATEQQIIQSNAIRQNFHGTLTLEGEIVGASATKTNFETYLRENADKVGRLNQDLQLTYYDTYNYESKRCKLKGQIADLEVASEEARLNFKINPDALTKINLNLFKANSEQEQIAHQVRFLKNFEFDAACVAKAEDVDPTGDVDEDGVPNYVDLCNRMPADKTETIDLTGERIGCSASQILDPV